MSGLPNPQPYPGGFSEPACMPVSQTIYGPRRYHENLCQPVAMLPTLRHPCEYSSATDVWRPGRFEPRSIVPVRAVDRTPVMSDTDDCGIPDTGKCRYHYGFITHNRRGRMDPYLASEPAPVRAGEETVELRKNHRMLVCRLMTDDPEGIIPRGRFFYRGSYQAPWWTDLHVHSFRVFCAQKA